jgi:hypothetical protein
MAAPYMPFGEKVFRYATRATPTGGVDAPQTNAGKNIVRKLPGLRGFIRRSILNPRNQRNQRTMLFRPHTRFTVTRALIPRVRECARISANDTRAFTSMRGNRAPGLIK